MQDVRPSCLLFLGGCLKTFMNVVIPSEARNLTLDTRGSRDCALCVGRRNPWNDRPEGFFSIPPHTCRVLSRILNPES
jgi:hypothetical protein